MARRPGTDHGFWTAPTSTTLVSALDKYERLLELAEADPDDRRPLIRALAERWPAATREAEMIGPQRTRDRRDALVRARGTELSTRGAWWSAGAGSAMLWGEVHERLRALRVERARGVRTFGELQDARWSRLPLAPETRLSSRFAYLLLAAEMAADPPELFYVLFERSGHWDRRPGDPQTGREPI